jgi:hypothetical protein
LHASWRAGSSGTLFFRDGARRDLQESDHQGDRKSDQPLQLSGAIVAKMKKRDCDHLSQSLFLFLQSLFPEFYSNPPALHGFRSGGFQLSEL